ncbi:MAG: Metal-dependent hydrolase [Pseudonocardiales bacterium]|nr:Metal-dependent hydrolase [Jatrophihabitantaceae bacterium]MCW2602368.1 Metal-dependent hydrolase [Pseudonocardiales bacterium]
MRVATFNILHGRSLHDGEVQVDRFADAIRALDADVLGLQEVDLDQPRSAGADLTEVAAQAMGATDHRFVAALSGLPGGTWTAATGAEQPGAASYGVALLSRYPVRSWQIVRLPMLPVRVPFLTPDRKAIIVREEPRVAVAAVVATPLGDITFAVTHLTFLPGWNSVQLRRIVRATRDATRLILMGDLNMGPGPARRVTGLTPLAHAATFPLTRPLRQLDHILARGDVGSPREAAAIALPVSDHRALSVVL